MNRPGKRQKQAPKTGGRPRSRGKGARRSGSAKPPQRHHLYGLHTVRAALRNPARRAHRLLLSANAQERLADVVAERPDLPVESRETAELNALTGADAVHQGAVLECDPLDGLDPSELFQLSDMRLLVMLDQITDPHNVGAILRSAVAMGAGAVLATSRETALETPVLAKSASGALDMIPIMRVRTLAKTVSELGELGFSTIGLDSEGPQPLEEALEQASGGIALVLGAEGRGLRQQTREACTALARLDLPGPIASLNVSNAAALACYLARRRLQRG